MSTTTGLLNRLPPTWGYLLFMTAALTMQVSSLPILPLRASQSHRGELGSSPPSPSVLRQAWASTARGLLDDVALPPEATAAAGSVVVVVMMQEGEPLPPPSLARVGDFRPVRSTRESLLFPSPGSVQREMECSAKATFREDRSQVTRWAPRPSWMWPQTARRGRTRQSCRRSASQPVARRSSVSSQWVRAGVWVTTTSASRGMSSQSAGRSEVDVGGESGAS